MRVERVVAGGERRQTTGSPPSLNSPAKGESSRCEHCVKPAARSPAETSPRRRGEGFRRSRDRRGGAAFVEAPASGRLTSGLGLLHSECPVEPVRPALRHRRSSTVAPAPDAQASRRIAIGADVVGDAFPSPAAHRAPWRKPPGASADKRRDLRIDDLSDTRWCWSASPGSVARKSIHGVAATKASSTAMTLVFASARAIEALETTAPSSTIAAHRYNLRRRAWRAC